MRRQHLRGVAEQAAVTWDNSRSRSRRSTESAVEWPGWLPEIASRLLAWFAVHGRVLPWRGCRDPYPVWVSEIMLQQTRIETVLRYYAPFLARFPDVGALARASEEEVRAAWSGLGYYRRAHHLQLAAREVVDRHGGCVPREPELLARLPGIGRYTLGAICSAVWDEPLPILDGNVERVLCRLLAVRGDPRSTAVRRQLWRLAAAVLPPRDRRPGDFNQALMDLGAQVCTPRRPDCAGCPLALWCLAKAQAIVEELPEIKQKSDPPITNRVALWCCRPDGRLLFVQRPAQGLLASLWEPPAIDLPGPPEDEEPASFEAAALTLARQWQTGPPCRCGVAEHRFTHRRWRVTVFRAEVAEEAILTIPGARWLDPDDLSQHGIPSATQKMLAVFDPDVRHPRK